jgi:hypothetical protein
MLSTGQITLPMPEPSRTWLRDLRIGKVDKPTVIDTIGDLRSQLATLTDTADLPERPDYPKLNDWLVDVYTRWWNPLRL